MNSETVNPKFNFEALRSTYEKFPFLAKTMAPIIQTVYIGEVDAFCLADQKGDIFTREEFQKLVIELEKFYDIISNDNITNSNEYRNNKSCNQQHMKIRKLKQAQRVYLIQKSNGDCKIGVTSNLNSRLSQIRTVEPQAILLHSFNADDAYKAESTLHHIYRNQNVGGEWFRLSNQDIKYIQMITEYREYQFLRGTGL